MVFVFVFCVFGQFTINAIVLLELGEEIVLEVGEF
jgi:hypothetical protein